MLLNITQVDRLHTDRLQGCRTRIHLQQRWCR